MILTYLWPWNKVKVVKPGMKCNTLRKIIIMQNLEELPWTVSDKRTNVKVFVNINEITYQLSPLNKCKNWKKCGIFTIYLTYVMIPQSFNLTDWEQKIFS